MLKIAFAIQLKTLIFNTRRKLKRQKTNVFSFSHLKFLANQTKHKQVYLFIATIWVSMIICFNFYLLTIFSALDQLDVHGDYFTIGYYLIG